MVATLVIELCSGRWQLHFLHFNGWHVLLRLPPSLLLAGPTVVCTPTKAVPEDTNQDSGGSEHCEQGPKTREAITQHVTQSKTAKHSLSWGLRSREDKGSDDTG